MEKLRVELGKDSYDILFDKTFDALPGALEAIHAPRQLLIVTDSNVCDLYAGAVRDKLCQAGYSCDIFAFPAGEQNKHMETILSICDACVSRGLDRKSMIIALGGGVVGDMAGFAAAIYMRGIDFVQIPTTLLSQSDSSVGGKTGIDFAQSKNILGAFHQPKLVYINVDTLKTLPEREFMSGMGEVIKHGMIKNGEFFAYLMENAEKIKQLDHETLMRMAKINCAIKAQIVSADEKEFGLRAILNFGHTIGHAVESAKGFALTHGECVALGMCAACRIAVRRGIIGEDVLTQLETVLKQYGFALKTTGIGIDTVCSYMRNDKKKINGILKFILPVQIGEVIQVTDVTREEIFDAVKYIISEE